MSYAFKEGPAEGEVDGRESSNQSKAVMKRSPRAVNTSGEWYIDAEVSMWSGVVLSVPMNNLIGQDF